MDIQASVLDADGAAMTVTQALGRGVRALNGSKRMWFVFYAVTTAASLCVAAAAMAAAFPYVSKSAWTDELAVNLNIQWISEFIAQYGAATFYPVLAVMAGAAAVTILAYLFLLGGAIQLFSAREPFSAPAFFAGCGRNFKRLVKLALISAIFYGIVLAIGGGISAVGDAVWGKGSEATPLVHWSWFHAAATLCLFGFVNLVFDYARIRLVADDSRKTWRAALGSFRFVWKNFGRTAGLYVVVSLFLVAMLAAYYGLSVVLSRPTLGAVLLLLVVQQAMVIGKMWTRLLYYSTGCEMYSALKPVVVIMEPEPVAAVEPVAACEAVPAEPEPAPAAEPEIVTAEPEPAPPAEAAEFAELPPTDGAGPEDGNSPQSTPPL
jgi:hypothetical protein